MPARLAVHLVITVPNAALPVGGDNPVRIGLARSWVNVRVRVPARQTRVRSVNRSCSSGRSCSRRSPSRWCLGGRPTPTARQESSGGPPPQVLLVDPQAGHARHIWMFVGGGREDETVRADFTVCPATGFTSLTTECSPRSRWSFEWRHLINEDLYVGDQRTWHFNTMSAWPHSGARDAYCGLDLA